MKIKALGVLLALGFPLATGCTRPVAENPTRSQGSVATSQDDALVYAADSDTGQLYVFDTAREQVIAAVKVGDAPAQVVVGKDDTVYVSNKGARSVSVVRRGDWKEAVRLETGVEPNAMAIAGDGKSLYVVSATAATTSDYGVLTSFDTATLTKNWELPVGAEPRGLALLNGNKAMVSLFKDGDVTLVDLTAKTVLKNSTDVNAQLNRLPVQGSKELFVDETNGHHVRAANNLVVANDGQMVFALANLSSSQLIKVDPAADDPTAFGKDGGFIGGGGFGGAGGNNGGSAYGSGSCGATAISSPALLAFEPNGNAAVDDLINCQPGGTDHPPTVMNSGNPTVPLQAPTAAAIDATGKFAFVVHHDSNNVAVVDLGARALTQGALFSGTKDSAGPKVQNVVSVGAGPTGIALAKNGSVAWVYNAFDHSLSKLQSDGGSVGVVKTHALGTDVLPADVVIGRKLFFNTTDSRMTTVGLSCGSCHFDGREDGHVWNFTSGPRQTPTLAGRMLEQTQPLHWDGEFQNMTDLSHAITGRMGGEGITPAMAKQLSAYLASLPAAENPHRLAERTPAQLRGAQVFTKAQCNSCHSGEALTNNGFANVGTLAVGGLVQDDPARLKNGLNTPSLLGLARSAPYLHDGSAATLKERLLRGKADDRHGLTAQLTPDELDDLVAYLQTL